MYLFFTLGLLEIWLSNYSKNINFMINSSAIPILTFKVKQRFHKIIWTQKTWKKLLEKSNKISYAYLHKLMFEQIIRTPMQIRKTAWDKKSLNWTANSRIGLVQVSGATQKSLGVNGIIPLEKKAGRFLLPVASGLRSKSEENISSTVGVLGEKIAIFLENFNTLYRISITMSLSNRT